MQLPRANKSLSLSSHSYFSISPSQYCHHFPDKRSADINAPLMVGAWHQIVPTNIWLLSYAKWSHIGSFWRVLPEANDAFLAKRKGLSEASPSPDMQTEISTTEVVKIDQICVVFGGMMANLANWTTYHKVSLHYDVFKAQ